MDAAVYLMDKGKLLILIPLLGSVAKMKRLFYVRLNFRLDSVRAPEL
jgi:hypothetical protein